MRTLRDKLTYANVISTFCLFMLLGGIAYAAGLPKNSVGAKQIKNGSITGKEIKDRSISASKLSSPVSAGPPRRTIGVRGLAGPQGPTGPRGPQGTTNSGAYATVHVGDEAFLGDHPGFASLERVQEGVTCLTPTAGTSIAHPIASVDLANSGGEKPKFAEPFTGGVVDACDPGELEVQTFELFEIEPSAGEDEFILEPSNSVAFTVFVPIP